MRRTPLILLAASLGLAPLAGLPAASAAGDPAAVTFGVPRIVDPTHLYGEPDIKIAPDGTIYASGPQGTGTQRSVWNVSVDGGDSYRMIRDLGGLPPSAGQPTAVTPGKSTLGPGGGDTEIAIARDGTTFYSDLYALVCFTGAVTHDRGATVSSTPAGCSTPAADRQWLGVFDPAPADATISRYTGPTPLVYLSYTDEATTGGNDVAYTTDGTNYHFGDNAGVYADDGSHRGLDTPITVDQHTGDLVSVVTDGTSKGLALAVGVPDQTGHLTFHYNPIAGGLPGSPGVLFPNITQDAARTLYAVWIDDTTYQTYYSYSPVNAAGTDWTAWSAPIQISSAPSGTGVFNWAEAGAPGVLDVAWYGTAMTPAQLGPAGPSAQKDQAWDVFFAQVSGASSAAPSITQSKATPHPMHYNDICLLGAGCIAAQGNRNLADFFELAIGTDGRARIIYPDTSNGLIQPGVTGPADGVVDHPGAELDTVITQNTGLNARTGQPLSANDSIAPTGSITDPAGDAVYPAIAGTAVPAADIRSVALSVSDGTVHVVVTTTGGTVGDAATAGAAPYAELVVRWQQGNTLYHAAVEQAAGGQSTQYYAGATQTTDLCSVSACDPHYLDYVAPPQPGAVRVPGKITTSPGTTTYTLDVPASAVGSPTSATLLEEVAGYVLLSPKSASVPLTNGQAYPAAVPLEVEGTRTFNAAGTGAPSPVVPEAPYAIVLPLLGVAVTGIVLRHRRTAAKAH